jgi:hypothetical protein
VLAFLNGLKKSTGWCGRGSATTRLKSHGTVIKEGGLSPLRNRLTLGFISVSLTDVRVLTANSVLAFGAVDFVVAKGNKHYFLEVNTTPGFSCDPTRDKYIASFKSLLHTNPTEVRAHARG